MPIIEEISKGPEVGTIDAFDEAIELLSKDLPIPTEFMADDVPTDPEKVAKLKEWKNATEMHLYKLQEYLRTKPELELEQRTRVVISAGLLR
ncbi:hypothetical protein DACRYDRAFT_103609, partial [Dacryopinax primogenitus]